MKNTLGKSIDNLKFFLKEMFQFNHNDLDFGIYKIYNLKRKHIESFIDGNGEQDLVPTIEQILKEVNFENQTEKLKDRIYNHILGFFQMYYSNGDFGYNDRSRDLYKVPYEADYDGSDTLFHWKHKGSLYIKSATSFNAIKFELNGKKIEYRLETNTASENESTSRNNNKDDQFKHYRFDRIQKIEGVYQVIFNFSTTSTSKVEIYKAIYETVFGETEIDKYLTYEKNGNEKTVFVDLSKDFDNIQNGQIKGLSALRQKKKKVATSVNKNFERGTKIYDDKKKIFLDKILADLYTLDQKLNSFYIGHDADYFIHKNLNEFLNHEKQRYIKNYVFDDLESIYLGKLDNTTILIAKAFDRVSSRIIEFLSAIEDFQKHLFTKKKKVVQSEYCITLDYINEDYYTEILANKTQVEEWQQLFNVEVKCINDVKENPTMVLDTKFFRQADGSNPFKDKILAEIEDLEEKCNGLLINTENYQGLELLMDKYSSRIDGIYTDPPYNTGSDSFKYQDRFRHSSWASMIHSVLEKLHEYLREKAGIAISINEDECHHLKLLLDSTFGSSNYLTNATVKVRHEERILKGDKDFHECTENLFVYRKTSHFTPGKRVVDNSDISAYKYSILEKSTSPVEHKWGHKTVYEFTPEQFEIIEHKEADSHYLQKINIRGGLREGNSSGRFYVANLEQLFDLKRGYLFKVMNMGADGLGFRYFVIPPKDSSRVNSDYFQGIPLNRKDTKEIPYPNILNFSHSTYYDFESVFNRVGTEGGIQFRNGKKPIKFIEHVFNLLNITNLDYGFVLDPFGGSASTYHSILSINHYRSKRLKAILFEMGEYFNTVTIPRAKKSVFAHKWTKNSFSEQVFTKQIFKYQVLEQYEDVLDNLQVYEGDWPKDLPIKYLYKPEQNSLDHNLDIFHPFSNGIKYGRAGTVGFVDLIETYNYLVGYFIKTIKPYTIGGKHYKAVETPNGVLVIWRDIELHEDDSAAIIEIALQYKNIHTIEVNAEFATLQLDKNNHLQVGDMAISLKIIHKAIFNQ